jgi:CorA-like Mg2+ transporter protein
VRLGLVTRPGAPDELPYAPLMLEDFEVKYCDDRFWGRSGERSLREVRLVVTGLTLSMVGAHADQFYADAEHGLLAQFRHQYFLLFLVAHFHKASLLSISDELAVAMNRLVVGDTESVKAFKRTIRQMMEAFLRFTHRYWFCQISNQELAQSVFDKLQRHLGNQALYDEVRDEVMDMNNYLDSDSTRRQTNTVLRLTVVTILGLIGTVATGFLGMNLIAAADEPLALRLIAFVAILAATFVVTIFLISRARRLADFLEALSDERVSWRAKARTLWRVFRR